MSTIVLNPDSVWLDKYKYDDAERLYYEKLDGVSSVLSGSSNPADLIGIGDMAHQMISRLEQIEACVKGLESRVVGLEKQLHSSLSISGKPAPAAAPAAKKPAPADDDDDDCDLFGSESEDEEAEKVKQQRLKEYAEKKSKKPALVAKSNVILDVKPWDDETDMAAMEKNVREIKADGLLWGAAKLVPLAYGIKKLQISTVIEDDKISVDWLTEEIEKLEDLVQSVDIAAFNKI